MPSTGIDRIDGNTTSVAVKAPCTVAANNPGSPITLSGIQTIDGVTLQAGGSTDTGQGLPDRVLVNDQADQTLNGIYLVATGPWIRAYDFDGNRDAVTGTQVFVRGGNDYANTNWFLTTTDNPIEFGVSDISWSLESVTPNIADTLQFVPAPTNAPDVTYVGLNAVGPDGGLNSPTGLGIIYSSWGTTNEPLQFNGLVETHTGRHVFQINEQNALHLTDTYWNPNSPYDGPTNTWGVISSGWCAPGSDGLAVLSAECSEPTNIGCGWVIGAKGEFGQVHFLSNGALGHVTISSISGTNPNGTDEYTACNNLRFSGSFPGNNTNCLIFNQLSGESGDTSPGISFYCEGAGSYTFSSDNTGSSICTLQRTANAVNAVIIAGAPAGGNPIVTVGGATGGSRLTVAGLDTGGVDICNGGQYNGSAACAPLARFYGGFEPTNYFEFTAGTKATLTTNGGDLLLEGGSGFVAFGTYTGGAATSAGYITIHDAAGNARKLMVGT